MLPGRHRPTCAWPTLWTGAVCGRLKSEHRTTRGPTDAGQSSRPAAPSAIQRCTCGGRPPATRSAVGRPLWERTPDRRFGRDRLGPPPAHHPAPQGTSGLSFSTFDRSRHRPSHTLRHGRWGRADPPPTPPARYRCGRHRRPRAAGGWAASAPSESRRSCSRRWQVCTLEVVRGLPPRTALGWSGGAQTPAPVERMRGGGRCGRTADACQADRG